MRLARTRFFLRQMGWSLLVFAFVHIVNTAVIITAVFFPENLLFGPSPMSRTLSILASVLSSALFAKTSVKMCVASYTAIRLLRSRLVASMFAHPQADNHLRTLDDLIRLLTAVSDTTRMDRAREFLRSAEYYTNLGQERMRAYEAGGDEEKLTQAMQAFDAATRQMNTYDRIMRGEEVES